MGSVVVFSLIHVAPREISLAIPGFESHWGIFVIFGFEFFLRAEISLLDVEK